MSRTPDHGAQIKQLHDDATKLRISISAARAAGADKSLIEAARIGLAFTVRMARAAIELDGQLEAARKEIA